MDNFPKDLKEILLRIGQDVTRDGLIAFTASPQEEILFRELVRLKLISFRGTTELMDPGITFHSVNFTYQGLQLFKKLSSSAEG